MKEILNDLLCSACWITTNEIAEIIWKRFPTFTKSGILMALRILHKKSLVDRKEVYMSQHGRGFKNVAWRKINGF